MYDSVAVRRNHSLGVLMRQMMASLLFISALSADPQIQFVRGTPFDAESQPNIRLWADAEYLCWWSKNAPLPVAIATTGSSTDSAPAALGEPGTEVLFGNQSISNGALSGVRVAVRSWVDQKNDYGVELSGFYLPEKTHTAFSMKSSSVLGVPFDNVAPFPLPPEHGGWNLAGAGETAILLAYEPTSYTGSLVAKSTNQLWGVELNGLFHFLSRPTFRLSALGGICYTDLSEHLNINYYSTNSPNDIFLTAVLQDRFHTRNEIYTAQAGLRGEWSNDWFFATFLAKIGLGGAMQMSYINGSFTDTISTLYFNYGNGQSGGIFAQPTNSGKHTQGRFAAIPSTTVRFGLNLHRNLRLSVGYDFLFLSNVLRPGDQIDRVINETQAGSASGGVPTLTGPERPKVLMDQTNYWAQGINAGMEARF